MVATTVANTDSDWKASLSLVLDLAKGELKETETWLSTSGSANKLFVFVTADVCATFRKLQSLSTNAAQRLLLGGTDIVERNDKFQFRADDEEASTDSPAPMQTLDLAVLVAVPATLLGLMK